MVSSDGPARSERVARAQSEAPSPLVVGPIGWFSPLEAAKRVGKALSTFLDGSAGLAADSPIRGEDYCVIGRFLDHRATVTLYLPGRIAKIKVEGAVEGPSWSFDLKFDRKGRSRYRPEPLVTADGRRGPESLDRHYFSEHLYASAHDTDLEGFGLSPPPDLLADTERFLSRRYMMSTFAAATRSMCPTSRMCSGRPGWSGPLSVCSGSAIAGSCFSSSKPSCSGFRTSGTR